MLKVIFISFLGSFLLSCGIGVGFAQNHGGTSLSYQVPVKDMKFEGEVSSTVKGPSVFCIFPAYKPLMKQAMEKLNAQAGLKNGNKAVFNVRADVEDKFYLFWCTRHVTVSGDVYSIVKEEQSVSSNTHHSVNKQNLLESYWEALKKGDLQKIKANIHLILNKESEEIQQEGYYFLGDIAILENDSSLAEMHYKKGISIVSNNLNMPEMSFFKKHVKNFGLMYPDKQEIIQNIFVRINKKEVKESEN